jgi:hypothetical protein
VKPGTPGLDARPPKISRVTPTGSGSSQAIGRKGMGQKLNERAPGQDSRIGDWMAAMNRAAAPAVARSIRERSRAWFRGESAVSGSS